MPSFSLSIVPSVGTNARLVHGSEALRSRVRPAVPTLHSGSFFVCDLHSDHYSAFFVVVLITGE